MTSHPAGAAPSAPGSGVVGTGTGMRQPHPPLRRAGPTRTRPRPSVSASDSSACAAATAASSSAISSSAASVDDGTEMATISVSGSTTSDAPLGSVSVGRGDVRALLEALDVELDALGDVRGLDLERARCWRPASAIVPGADSPIDEHGHVDLDLLALLDDEEVDVLDDLVHRVLLHVLDERELLLAVDVELEHGVRAADQQRDLVAGQGDVQRGRCRGRR